MNMGGGAKIKISNLIYTPASLQVGFRRVYFDLVRFKSNKIIYSPGEMNLIHPCWDECTGTGEYILDRV